ncbi:MAG: hypothetical protein K0S40_724 [Actinomycetospora sp.]|nr:hypothetical protein [Actinomycetospora sp.]
MGAVRSARVLAAGATWRLTGLASAGDALLDAVAHGEETERTLAAMLLVRAGDRSVPLVTDAVLSGRGDVDLVDVLASIDTTDARAALARLAQAPPSAVPARVPAAATEALRTLDRIRDRDDG